MNAVIKDGDYDAMVSEHNQAVKNNEEGDYIVKARLLAVKYDDNFYAENVIVMFQHVDTGKGCNFTPQQAMEIMSVFLEQHPECEGTHIDRDPVSDIASQLSGREYVGTIPVVNNAGVEIATGLYGVSGLIYGDYERVISRKGPFVDDGFDDDIPF